MARRARYRESSKGRSFCGVSAARDAFEANGSRVSVSDPPDPADGLRSPGFSVTNALHEIEFFEHRSWNIW
jgi:hypothetical protein